MSATHSQQGPYEPLLQSTDSIRDLASPNDEFEDEPNSLQNSFIQESALDDRIRWIHFLFGAAVLLPWNALITATPYFLSRLEGSRLKSSFTSYLSITFTLANFIFLAHATVTSKQSIPARRILLSTIFLLVLLAFLAFSPFFSFSPSTFFFLSLLNAACQATAGSYLQNAVIATASLFGPIAMQAVMAGQAAVGVAVSAVQLINSIAAVHSTKGSGSDDETDDNNNGAAEARSAASFFGLSTAFLVVVLVAHLWLTRMPEYKALIPQAKTQRSSSVALLNESEEAALSESRDNEFDEDRILGASKPEKNIDRLIRIVRTNFDYFIAVGNVFVVTLTVFPPITSAILPSSPAASPLIFVATHFLVFNLGDLLGRQMCSRPSLLIWNPKYLLSLSLARWLFIPAFLVCTSPVTTPSEDSQASLYGTLAVSIDSTFAVGGKDIYFFALLLAFGISNGYITSMCMMSAPSLVHNPRLRGRADVDATATLGSFFLVGGLVVGSAMSFAVRARVCGCNPFLESK